MPRRCAATYIVENNLENEKNDIQKFKKRFVKEDWGQRA